jgi:hypothetical protein
MEEGFCQIDSGISDIRIESYFLKSFHGQKQNQTDPPPLLSNHNHYA